MKINLKYQHICSLLVLLATTFGVSTVASAQNAPNSQSPNAVIERAFFKDDPNFYGNNSFSRNIDWMLGPGTLFRNSFPENEIARDAELVNIVYRDLLAQQSTNDPILRTPDLPNPYGSSLLTSPQMNRLRAGTEFRFESVQSR
jgi:hypothetical protein